ncbi:TPA: decaprenyl-phosphate phosphoribosyltransferase [Candidatus Latescibacteria bacterium]|nr:decaprenyl-phosphate phosphoribosyltransferase [Candidatus Latescibacterota bacterium]
MPTGPDSRRCSLILVLLSALRPKQWIKNGFVLAALVFSRHLFDLDYVLTAVTAAIVFVALSGAVYLINDIFDRENDLKHPEKRLRAIASGRLPVSVAIAAAVVLVASALYTAFSIDTRFGVVSAVYWVLHLAYSSVLKHVVILDVMIIASGFLLRAAGGAYAIDVSISSWFILCTMLLALFLGFVKRRQEIALLEDGAGEHRKILDDYDLRFLDQAISIVTAGSILAYALYTMSPEVAEKLGTEHLNLTVPFVVYGMLRYLYVVYKKGEGGDTASTLMSDIPLIVNGVLWLATLVAILYFGTSEGVAV